MPELGSLQELIPAVVFMLVLLGMFWWIVIRPAKKRQHDHTELVENVMPGDRIITVGGIYGTIKQVTEDTIDVEVSERLTLTMDRRAVRRLQSDEAS